MGRNSVHNATAIAVCVVEYNPLAARHLEQLLGLDDGLCLLPRDQVLTAKPDSKPAVGVFVVDAGTLPTPLSKYLRYLRFRFPDARFLILGDPEPEEELCRLLFLGIQGFLCYQDVPARLLEAVRAVHAGETWVAPAVLERYGRFASRVTRSKELRHAPLTPREQRICDLIRRRLSNKEVAVILNLTESTVKYNLSRIFAKLGVRDRSALAELPLPPAPGTSTGAPAPLSHKPD
ncbi:MAG: LuxR C-terminal-related transcriptional regulator [Terriglobia bacterium]